MIKLAKIWLSIWVKNQFIWLKNSEQILGWRPASRSKSQIPSIVSMVFFYWLTLGIRKIDFFLETELGCIINGRNMFPVVLPQTRIDRVCSDIIVTFIAARSSPPCVLRQKQGINTLRFVGFPQSSKTKFA